MGGPKFYDTGVEAIWPPSYFGAPGPKKLAIWGVTVRGGPIALVI